MHESLPLQAVQCKPSSFTGHNSLEEMTTLEKQNCLDGPSPKIGEEDLNHDEM